MKLNETQFKNLIRKIVKETLCSDFENECGAESCDCEDGVCDYRPEDEYEGTIQEEKKALKKAIKKMLRESIFENGFDENFYGENFYGEAKRKKSKSEKSDSGEKKEGNKSKHETSVKRSEVMRWLDSAQELHSVLSYRLWPDMDKDTARSLFSRKYRGEDASGNSYSFDDEDINKLFNMKDRYIDQIS